MTLLTNNVFISGSIDFYGELWSKTRVDNLAYILANALVREGFKITSGFGIGIGSYVSNGALDAIDASKHKYLDEYICLRPFQQNINNFTERKAK